MIFVLNEVSFNNCFHLDHLPIPLFFSRMFQDMRLHSCRVCGAPIVWLYKSLQNHARLHGMNASDYIKKFADHEGRIAELPEELRVNGLAKGLTCPECGETLRGFQHMYIHMSAHLRKSSAHRVKFQKTLFELNRQLGLTVCGRCKEGAVKGAVLRDAMPIHTAFFHQGERAAAEVVKPENIEVYPDIEKQEMIACPGVEGEIGESSGDDEDPLLEEGADVMMGEDEEDEEGSAAASSTESSPSKVVVFEGPFSQGSGELDSVRDLSDRNIAG